DPQRYVSAHHARVQFREGHYYLHDVSTNGVFVNDDTEALAKRGSDGYKLRSGDVIRMGDYQIVVALESQPQPLDPGAAVPTSIPALHTLGRAAQTDIGAMLNLDELLVPDGGTGGTGDNLLPVNAYGQAIAQASPPVLMPAKVAAKQMPSTEPTEE